MSLFSPTDDIEQIIIMWDEIAGDSLNISYSINCNTTRIDVMEEHRISFLTIEERFEDNPNTINVIGTSFSDCVKQAYDIWKKMIQ